MSEIKVSIIIPVYNVENYLRVCLNSVCRQTLEGIEVIAVDDGSTDGSPAILEEYAEQYPDFFHVYHIPNQGVSHARNYGVSKAQGEYILFVDSDDFIAPDMCELLYGKAVRDNDDVVFCRYFSVRERPLTKRITRSKSKAYIVSYDKDFNVHEHKYQLTHISPFPWDKLFRRSLVEKYPFPQGLRFEDLAIMYPLMCDAQQIGIVPQYLYNYRKASETSFLNSLNEKTLDIIPALTMMVDSLKANGHFSEFYDEIEYICVRHLLVRFNNIFDDRRKRALAPENRGKLELKTRLITQSMDFLEKNFKNWRSNRYLLYSSSSQSREMMPIYRSKRKMLRIMRRREHMPVGMIKLKVKLRDYFEIKKKAWRLFAKRKNKFRHWKQNSTFLKIFSLPRDVQYTRYYLKMPVSANQVLVESKHGEDVAGNMFRMLYEMRDEKYRQFEVFLALEESRIDGWREKLESYGIDFVNIIQFNSKEYLRILATAKYLMTDTSFPSYYIKRPEQVYLNTWHGTPLKAMGRRVPQREYALGNVQRNFFIADYILYQNEFARDVMMRDYMLNQIYEGKIMLSGYPRNSAFFDDERYDAIRDELELGDMKVIAYMPTWRGLLNKKDNKKQVEEIRGYLYQLDAALEDEQVLFVKLHPYVKRDIQYDDFEHIRPFPDRYETYDFLNATDMLITDYSSIMFDYAVSGKKIILFTYDRREYLKGRGMYIRLSGLEFPKADTVEELMEKINSDEPAAYEAFRAKYCPYDTGDTAKEVCELLFFGKEPSFKVERAEHNGKKNVLVMINGLANDEATTKRIERFNSFSTKRFNYYYCVKSNNIKAASSKMSLLKRNQYYMPLQFDVNYTIPGRIACIFAFKLNWYGKWTDRQIDRLATIEKEKYFGNIRFDYVVNMTNRDRLMHHINGQFDVPKIYNFVGYKDVIYKKDRSYRKNAKYVAKHLDLYDYVVSTEEVRGFPSDALKKGRVELIISETGRFRMDKVLANLEEQNGNPENTGGDVQQQNGNGESQNENSSHNVS